MMKNKPLIYAMTFAVLSFLFFDCNGAAQNASKFSGNNYRAEREMENNFIDAVAVFNAGRLEDAQSLFSSFLVKYPDDDAARYYMGMVAMTLGDYETAELDLYLATQIDPTNFWYRYRLASLYQVIERPDLSLEIYEQLLIDFPMRSDLYYGLVNVYLSLGEYEKAITTIDDIDQYFGKTDVAAITKFDILCQLGREDEAYAMIMEYNEEYSSPEVLTLLGDYNMSMYNDSLALANYNEALEIYPGYPMALLGKAEVLRIMRNYPEYFEVLNEFVSNKDTPFSDKFDYLRTVVTRSDLNFLKNFQNDFDTVINSCLALHSDDSQAIRLAGIYYYTTDRTEEAKAYFKQNVDNDPEDEQAAYDYAEAIMYMGEFEELSDFCRTAFVNFPHNQDFLEMAVYADYTLKDYDKVILTCEKIVFLSADTTSVVTALSTLGDIYHLQGKTDLAFKSYETALKISPNYLPVLNNYAYYLSVENKKLKKAAAMSKITIEAEPDNATYLDTYGWILYLQGKAADAKPYFKHAMLYDGRDSAVILDHYAEVLFTLGEYDLAFVYWNQAVSKDVDGEIENLQEKIKERRATANSKK